LVESGQRIDVAVCDLKIPTQALAVAEVAHGMAVLTAIREQLPGTPIVAFTGYKTREFLDVQLKAQVREDYLGAASESPMISVFEKDQLPELVEHLERLSQDFKTLSEVDLVTETGPALRWDVQKVVQIYARQRSCVVCHVSPLGGGYSGVPVLRVKMEKAVGADGGSAVVRLATVASVRAEQGLHTARVSGILPLGSYAEITGVVTAGAGDLGGAFYQVAEDARPLWEIPAVDDQRAASAVETLSERLAAWTSSVPSHTLPLSEIRRSLLGDDNWEAAVTRCGLTVEEATIIEQTNIHIRQGTVHGDLHGGNVLVGEDPVLIDFATVADGATTLDAVTLELSFLFHPEAPDWEGAWPTAENLSAWTDVDAFVGECPFPTFVRACRAWALGNARGALDVVAVAYAYVLFQAKFDTSDEDRLRALMSGLAQAIREH
jgi:CheY-like chemotaxis protein